MDILIIKLAALGDVLRTTAILPGIRKKYPHANIVWLTKENAVDLFHGNPFVNEIYRYNPANLVKLSRRRFDWVINLDEDDETAALASSIRTNKLSGFYLNNANKVVPTRTAKEQFDMSALGEKPNNDILKKKNKKTVPQILYEILELKYEKQEPFFRLNHSQKNIAADFKRRYNISEEDLVIGINTGAADRWPKQLSVKKTAELMRLLHKDLNAKLVLFGGPNEVARNNEIIANAGVPLINAGCGNDLKEFPALVSVCDVFVTSDSLGLHVAIALKRKIVSFFGPTSAAEIETYGFGEKVISKSDCYCCYKPSCKATEAITPQIIYKAVEKVLKQKVYVLIAAFKEPNLNKSIDAFLNQNYNGEYEIIVLCPDVDKDKISKPIVDKYKNVRWFKDPGKGKSFALNLVFEDLFGKGGILVSTDGDVVVEKNALSEIVKKFKDPAVGCLTGRVVSANPINNMLGYWSHLLADAGAHMVRKEADEKDNFIECSGYLFAFRNNVIENIPLDVAEDTYIPYVFYSKGYKIRYAEKALVFVKNPNNFKDWLKQRTRTAKAHETLDKYVDTKTTPRVKTFRNEIKKGFVWALSYPQSLREQWWTFLLMMARFYMWSKVYWDTKLANRHYQDAWERVESAR